MSNYVRAISTLTGTIVGLGIFTLPLVVYRSGFVPFLLLVVVLGFAQYMLHSLYAEVVLSTKSYHQLPGYTGKYFKSPGAQRAVLVMISIGSLGTMLAYILIGGIFLNELLKPYAGDQLFFYTTLLFAVQAIIVFFGIKIIAKLEFIMTGFIFVLMGVMVWKTAGSVQSSNFIAVQVSDIFLSYGPIFLALSGTTAIPHVCRLLAHQKKKINKAIVWSISLSIIITVVFTLLVVGVTGATTTADSLSGLGVALNSLMPIVLLLGIIAIVTSYLVNAEVMREVLWWDFGLNKNLSWAIACFVPYIFYLCGVHNLTEVVSLTGAVTGGLLGIVMIAINLKAQKNPERISSIRNKLGWPMTLFLSLLFIFGMIYQLFNPS